MSHGKKSEMTIRTEMLADRLYARYQALMEAWPVPFGMEQMSVAELKHRWPNMTQEQRDMLWARQDVREALRENLP